MPGRRPGMPPRCLASDGIKKPLSGGSLLPFRGNEKRNSGGQRKGSPFAKGELAPKATEGILPVDLFTLH